MALSLLKAVTKLHPTSQHKVQTDVSNFCAVEIGLLLYVSSVECKTDVFLHTFLLLSELWLSSQNAGFAN